MKNIHLIGIGGTGLSAIARVLIEKGYSISGSDRALSPLAQKLQAEGVKVMIGHKAENIHGADLIVRSSAVTDDNPEIQAALAAGIPVLKRADFLDQLMTGQKCIAIAGTHGKTTTTAMIAWMLSALGADPSFIVGGVLKNLNTNARAGKGAYFVIEADEYDHMFLGLTPEIIVVTNMEHDHPDCFPTPEIYRQAFVDFIQRMPAQGTLLACAENDGSASLVQPARQSGYQVFTYGAGADNSYQAQNLSVNQKGGFDFDAISHVPEGSPSLMGHLSLQVPGKHNVLNSLVALAIAHRLNLPLDKAAQALGEFSGAGRRFDIVGEVNQITLIDDYAHHPTEIRAVLAAARSRYPARRIWAVWQPHTYSRTQSLFNEFVASFSDANRVIVTEIYAAREPAQNFSAAQLVESMPHPSAKFIAEIPAVSQYLLENLQPNDVVLVLSAGDADQINLQILNGLKARQL
jgi:UDP-N-acetylmuramate--alanine ligase